MWILALAPIIAGFALMLVAMAILLAEAVGKGALGVAEVTWEALNPANHRRTARQA